MKKLMLLLAIQTLAIAAQADTLNLYCYTEDKKFNKMTDRSFLTITDVLGEKAEINLPDARLMDTPEIKDGKLSLGFSNECDNSYEIVIREKTIKKALEEGTAMMTLKVSYFNANFPEDHDGEPVKATFRCQLDKQY
jgi:hypothetical protein